MKKINKSGSTFSIILWILLALVIVVIISVIVAWFVLSSQEGKIEEGIPEKGIDILDMPLTVSPDGTITVKWRVVGVDNIEESKLIVSLDPQGDTTLNGDIIDSTLKGEVYSSDTTAPTEGALFLIIYATDGTNTYRSEELVVEVIE